MTAIGIQRRTSPFLIAVAVLLPLSPSPAAGNDAQKAAIQGSRAPGMPDTNAPKDRRSGPVDVTFLKWRTAGVPPSEGVPARHLFKGLVNSDLGGGRFVGEVLDRQPSTPCTSTTLVPACGPDVPTITGPIVALHAIYEVQLGQYSFTALIQGGTNAGGVGLLNGVILAGWRTGAQVHVTFQTMTNCNGAPPGPCFRGVIRVGPVPQP